MRGIRLQEVRPFTRVLATCAALQIAACGGDRATANHGTLAFADSNPGEIPEEAGTFNVSVERTGGTDGAVTVEYAAVDGAAAAGSDYTLASGTLTWAAGESGAKSFTVTLLDDAVFEGETTETFQIVLSSPGGGAALGSPASLTTAIADNEALIEFAQADYVGYEGGWPAIGIVRRGSTRETNEVTYSTSAGTAEPGVDYEESSGAVSFPWGAAYTNASFTVTTLQDADVDGSRTVQLTLSAPTGSSVLLGRSTATLTIRDDPAPAAEFVRAFANLEFNVPVYLAAAPGDTTRLYVAQQDGLIRVFTNDESVAASSIFLDLSGQVAYGGEGGLLGLAFDPGFATNGLFYVNYSAGSPLRTVIARFHAASRDEADTASEVQLLTYPQGGVHFGGWLGFGADGKLYVTSGDAGDSSNGQRLDTLAGKILRINPDGSAPGDNPFASDGNTATLEHIWAYGFRNPWRASFDAATGELWVGDVGEGAWEELDIVDAGDNGGWSVCEGTRCSGSPTNYLPPLHAYFHDLGGSVTGGYVYRGGAIPAAQGYYFYADFMTGQVWALNGSGSGVSSNAQIDKIAGPASFGTDLAGELYLVSYSGLLYRLQPK